MKYAVFTVGMPEYTPEQGLAKLREFGYDGVEWRVIRVNPEVAGQEPSYWGNNLCTIDEDKLGEQAAEIKAMCDKQGLEISVVCSYLRSSDEIGRIEKAIAATKAMGVGKIRISPDGYDGKTNYRELFDKAVKDYGAIQELAKKYGVQVLLEMHMNTITPSASAAYRLASHFDPKYISVIYDTGNIVFEGYENYGMALEILGEYLGHVHVKNAAWKLAEEENGVKAYKSDWETFKDGYTDFAKFFTALKKTGYDGWVTFEDFSNQPTDVKLRDNLAFIKELVG